MAHPVYKYIIKTIVSDKNQVFKLNYLRYENF